MAEKVSAGKAIFKIACATKYEVLAFDVVLPKIFDKSTATDSVELIAGCV